ncbi:MAG: AAA family ATPase [Erysipelotrichaceae bacterium]|nr:AAA family ATPase [Erysipelotrichaceae bacterium]
MIYLKEFELVKDELPLIMKMKNIHNSYYPTGIFEDKGISHLDFAGITIFYGNNGTGKTTLLNIIGEKISAERKNTDRQSEIFYEYVKRCGANMNYTEELKEIKQLSSDDVFDYLLDVRAINSGVNRRKESLSEEYAKHRYSPELRNFRHDSRVEGSYETLVNIVDSRSKTVSKYVRSKLVNNLMPQQSNGESALDFWQQEIQDHAIYLLDEPENSLSPDNQLLLKKFIEDSVRFYSCQFIISTHSPFILSLDEALIYDLDDQGRKKKWQELENVRTYYQFFIDNKDKFE